MAEKTDILMEKQLKKMRMKRVLKRELGAWGFLLPHFFFFVLFIVIPVVYGFVMSFYRWSLLGTTQFVGLDNYVRIWNDSRFWQSVKNTVMFAIISIPLVMAVSMIFALLLKKKWYGKLWLLVAFVSPTFFSSVGVLTTWRWIFSSAPNGLLNYYLTKLGLLKQPISWFATPARAGYVSLVSLSGGSSGSVSYCTWERFRESLQNSTKRQK